MLEKYVVDLQSSETYRQETEEKVKETREKHLLRYTFETFRPMAPVVGERGSQGPRERRRGSENREEIPPSRINSWRNFVVAQMMKI